VGGGGSANILESVVRANSMALVIAEAAASRLNMG
jgi:hypothetical protein